MLPLLPALILLILQGPANLDIVQPGASLQPALYALQGLKPHDKASKEALASALKKSPALAFAFAHLLDVDLDIDEAPTTAGAVHEPTLDVHVVPTRSPSSPPEGFLDCRRSRDGPVS